MQDYVLHILDVPIACRQWGSDDKPTIIALHGWLDNANSFARLAPLLSSHRVIALDLPGHGRSGHLPASGDYDFIVFVRFVLALIDNLQLDKVTLLGHSMGAGVAVFLAGLFPERFDRVILLDGIGPPGFAPDAMTGMLAATLPKMAAARSAPVYPSQSEAIEARKAAGGIGEEGVALLLERGGRTTDDGYTLTTDPRLKWASYFRQSEEQIVGYIRRMRIPTLLLMAREGFPWGETMIAARVAAHPDIRRYDLQGKHHFHLDGPLEPIVDTIKAFLAETAQAHEQSAEHPSI